MNSIDLSVEIAGIKMQNPIMPASGCFGNAEEFAQLEGMDLTRLGAMVSKGTTLEPRPGKEQPRIWETASGMINCIGLENPGIDVLIKKKIPFMAEFGVPIIINVSGSKISDYAYMAKKLDRVKEVSALEINISCPNVEGGKIPFGCDPQIAAAVTIAVRQETNLPLIVKLTPNVTDVVPIAQAVESVGANAISMINTLKASFLYKGRIIQGGLSGPAIKNIALCQISQVVLAVKIPIIGIGGISTLQDIFDFLSVGASAVAIGTANFKDPLIMMKLINEMEGYCQTHQLGNLAELKKKIKSKGG